MPPGAPGFVLLGVSGAGLDRPLRGGAPGITPGVGRVELPGLGPAPRGGAPGTRKIFTSVAMRVAPLMVPVACTNAPPRMVVMLANLPRIRMVALDASTVVVPFFVAMTNVEPVGLPLTGPVTFVVPAAAVGDFSAPLFLP